jgi:hypothetical protein
MFARSTARPREGLRRCAGLFAFRASASRATRNQRPFAAGQTRSDPSRAKGVIRISTGGFERRDVSLKKTRETTVPFGA